MNSFYANDIIKMVGIDPILFSSTTAIVFFIAGFIITFLILRHIFIRIRVFRRYGRGMTYLAFLFAIAALPTPLYPIVVSMGLFGVILLGGAYIFLWIFSKIMRFIRRRI